MPIFINMSLTYANKNVIIGEMDISKKQINVLQTISVYRLKHGRAPTIREIRDESEISDIKSVHRMIKALVFKEYLVNEKGKWRSLLLTDRAIKLLNSDLLITPKNNPLFFQSPELTKNDVGIPTLAATRIDNINPPLRTDGTNHKNEIEAIIKSAASLNAAINKLNGTGFYSEIFGSSDTRNIWQLIDDSKAINRITWALVFSITIGLLKIFGLNMYASVGISILLIFYIKKILKE